MTYLHANDNIKYYLIIFIIKFIAKIVSKKMNNYFTRIIKKFLTKK